VSVTRRRARRLTRTLLVAVTAAGLIHAVAAQGDDDDHSRGTAASKPSVATPKALFAGQMIVEGIHGFSAAEVHRIQSAAGSAPVVVTDGEVYVVDGRGAYNELPLETMVVDPSAYAHVLGSSAIRRPLSAGIVVATSTARLFGYAVGDRIRVAGGPTLPVTALVDDRLLGGHQMALRAGVSVGLGAHADYLFVAAPSTRVPAMESAIQRALPSRRLRFVLPTGRQFFSPSGDVMSQSQLDELFGAFTVRRTATGFVQDPAWAAAHLERRRIVQLGVVECNKRIIGALVAAMTEITRRGWGHIINTADFIYEGGCWNSRMSRFEPGNISHHAWGGAIDINVAANPLGAVPHQDPRLVAIMKRYGFTWGGRWLRRDGNHFEWVGTGATASS
jgi:hypothetical protein